MPSERSLDMVQAVIRAHKPKCYQNGPGGGAHEDSSIQKIGGGYDHHKGHTAKKEEGKNKESQLISAISGDFPQGQGKPPKVKADHLPQLTVFYLKELGYFEGFVTGEMLISDDPEVICHIAVSTHKDDRSMHISYDIQLPNGKVQNVSSKIPLVTTPCPAGGFRYYFECPYCGKRIAVLYKSGDFFACRHCHRLTYQSQSSRKASGVDAINLELLGFAQDPRNWRNYAGKPTRKYSQALEEEAKFKKSLDAFNAKADARFKKALEGIDIGKIEIKPGQIQPQRDKLPILDVGLANDLFWAFWKKKIYPEALDIYYRAEKPVWLAYKVARHLERAGQRLEAMQEYENLLTAHQLTGYVPLPRVLEALFKLSKWSADKDKMKAVQYLRQYFTIEIECRKNTGCYLRYKYAARKLVNRLKESVSELKGIKDALTNQTERNAICLSK